MTPPDFNGLFEEAGGNAIVTGMNAGDEEDDPAAFSFAAYNRFQRTKRLGAIPWRRATAEAFRWPCIASATMARRSFDQIYVQIHPRNCILQALCLQK